ncbi:MULTISPECIES: energy transducer TonB [unclassified Pseudovibrio]|uniref:TonB family protein n=1 Tax=unclassified Pseudovibrio TaxID=2627060 RepID=UPI0007AE8D92|nr:MULTISPECIES: energy transducer TonB [unclassified Pseudovibrio]KZL01255.1 Gram-negative bacterial tonB protein [Pseudovibrio sp. W74]KZL11320.1 Gram-negative bacterial tonB protein [Pseudovibrio sp. Ad14]
MKKSIRRKIGGSALTTALLVSVSVHAAGFAWFYTRAPEVQVASTRSTSLSVVGSIEDLIAGSKEVVEPIEPDQPDEVEPREIETPIEQVKEIESVEPIELAKAEITPIKPIATQAVKPLPEPVAEGVTIKAEIEPIKPKEEIKPLKLELQPEQIKPAEVQEIKPVEVAKVLPVKQEEAKSAQPEKLDLVKQETPEETKPVEKKIAEPVDEKKELEAKPVETEVAAVTVPVPRAAPPRPKLLQKTAKKAPPKAKKEPAKKAGNSDVNSARGSKVARKGSNTSKNGNNIAGSGDIAGNAATSNYWGKVRGKIERAAYKRYPRREKRRNKSGQVSVSFTLHSNGTVTGVSVTKSSGNDRFDQAAVKAIKAASPFSSFPPSMKSKSIRRTLPIRFRVN